MTYPSTCDNCGMPIEWRERELVYAIDRLDREEHAACACDDDCAAEVKPWTRERILALMRESELEEDPSTGALYSVCEQALQDGEGTPERVREIWREAEEEAKNQEGEEE